MPASSSPMDFGLPPGSRHGIVLGQLFKLHPSFDEALLRLLLGTPESTYVVLVREKLASVNRMLYERWQRLQEEICCRVDGNAEATDGDEEVSFPSCCGNMSLYRRMHHRRHDELLGIRSEKIEDKDAALYESFLRHLSSSSISYVMHRIRFIHYKHYDQALLTARVVLDTFPYGGREHAVMTILTRV
jgi:hypothetical protein